MKEINPYLAFDGNCREAMSFYQSCLGGELQVQSFGDVGMAQGKGTEDRVMHARLTNGEARLMASDTMPGQPYEGMKNFGVALTFPTPDAARDVFDALAEGGQVTMPLGKTFWAEAFGMVTDRFGTPWMVNGSMKAE